MNNNLFLKRFGSNNTGIRNFQNSSPMKTSPAKRPLLSLLVLSGGLGFTGQLQCAGLEEIPWQGCCTEVSKLPWCSASSQLHWLNCPRTGNLVSVDPLSCYAQKNGIAGHLLSKILLFWRLPMRKLGAALGVLQKFRAWNNVLVMLFWWEIHHPTPMTCRHSLRSHKEQTPSKKEDGTLRRTLQLWGIECSLLYNGKILQCHEEQKDAVYIHCLVSASYFVLNFPADPAALW